MGRLAEALAAAREASPWMRRSRSIYIEEWVYLYWRLGQPDTAALLLGAAEARQARSGTPPQENERRLVAESRAALRAAMEPAAFAGALAAGAALAEDKQLAFIGEALPPPRSA
jgi:hypothetical protein